MTIQIEITQTETEIAIQSPYCDRNATVLKSRGAKWNGTAKAWIFKGGGMKTGWATIQELWGLSNEIVIVQVPMNLCEDGPQLTCGGYVLASRRSRDSAPNLVENLVEGTVDPRWGGSVKNPRVAPSGDAVFELEVRRDFAEALGLIAPAPAPAQEQAPYEPTPQDYADIEALRNEPLTQLQAERDALLVAKAELLAACEGIKKKYDELYENMNSDYAAFFTAMNKEVNQVKAAVAKHS